MSEKPQPAPGAKQASSRGTDVDVFTSQVAIIDFIDHIMPHLHSLVDLKAALVIWRKTHGWGKLDERIGLTELAKRANVDQRALKKRLKILLPSAGIQAEAIRTVTSNGNERRLRTRYIWSVNERVRAELAKAAAARNDRGVVAKAPPPLASNSPPGGGGESATTQLNTSSSSTLKNPVLSSASRAKNNGSAARKTLFDGRDDDGTPPKERLLSLYREKTGGGELPGEVLDRIRSQLEPRGLNLGGFVQFLFEEGHVLGNWQNPAGLLTKLARDYAAKAAFKMPVLVVPEPEGPKIERCDLCRGSGKLGESLCTCVHGLARGKHERSKASTSSGGPAGESPSENAL